MQTNDKQFSKVWWKLAVNQYYHYHRCRINVCPFAISNTPQGTMLVGCPTSQMGLNCSVGIVVAKLPLYNLDQIVGGKVTFMNAIRISSNNKKKINTQCLIYFVSK